MADKNPNAFMGWTLLHFAAQNGQLEACHLIMGNITENKIEGTRKIRQTFRQKYVKKFVKKFVKKISKKFF